MQEPGHWACQRRDCVAPKLMRMRMHCNVPPQPAPQLRTRREYHVGLVDPPMSHAGAPGIGETGRTLLSPLSNPNPVKLATGILTGRLSNPWYSRRLLAMQPVNGPSLEAEFDYFPDVTLVVCAFFVVV